MPQTNTQRQASLDAAGLNPTQQSGVQAGIGYAPPAINSTVLTPQANIVIPPAPPVNTGTADNIAVPNPTLPQTTKQITDASSAPTTAETQQADLGTQIADLMRAHHSQEAITATAESDPSLTSSASAVNDINSQLEGLNNQSLALQNEAQYTIPNAAMNSAEGLGRTTGGQAPLTASALRTNQIKQGAIATQALTLKSAAYTALGKYTLAKDAADRAATLAFDKQEQELNYKKAQLDALTPQLNRDQSARATKLTADLNQRQQDINAGREDAKTGQGLIAATLSLYKDDSSASFAAQQAMKVPLDDPQYLTKVLGLVGQYQQDPNKLKSDILDMQYKRAQTAYVQAQTAKLTAESKDTGLDPAQTIAYAQEYASTGRIPTGLPKGSFGAVAELAKGSPKPDGSIINSATGVIPSNIASTQIEGLGAMRDLTKKLGDLSTLYNNLQPHGGNVSTSPTDIKRFNDLKGEIVDLLSRARSGAALTESEVATYSAKLPGLPSLFSPGSIGQVGITDLNNSISGKLNTSLAAHGAVMVGYSKVDVGGQKYTVGEIVTNDKGQKGMVNSDGSITEI